MWKYHLYSLHGLFIFLIELLWCQRPCQWTTRRLKEFTNCFVHNSNPVRVSLPSYQQITHHWRTLWSHYNDVIMGTMASQIISLVIVYSTVYSGTYQRIIEAQRHWPLCGEITGDRKMFPFDDVIMLFQCCFCKHIIRYPGNLIHENRLI